MNGHGVPRTDGQATSDKRRGFRQRIGLVLGPASFVILSLASSPPGLQGDARFAAAATLWMAIWWISEAVPISATALLPIVLFPATGVLPAGEVTLAYGHPLIFLFLGGFALSAAIQRWDLHKRMALRIILAVGLSPPRMILGFMLATAFLSMWVSNTATTMMMVPIGLAVIRQVSAILHQKGSLIDTTAENFHFGLSLMLGIAYAASIGGIATIIGSPPNAIFVGYVQTAFGETITFLQWLYYGFPIAMGGLLIAWVYITFLAYPLETGQISGGHGVLRRAYRALGPMETAEARVALVFVTVAGLWITRGLFSEGFARVGLGGISDTTIAIFGVLLLFLFPAGGDRGALLRWDDMEHIPWGILILFGGGLALAQGIETSGAASWAAGQLAVFQGIPVLLTMAVVVIVVIFLTEVTSNTSTATIFMPVMAGVAAGMAVHPYLFMITAATAASCAFMLPVATPPNAVVFGSGYVKLSQMMRAGIWMNLVFVVLITAVAYWWLPRAWGLP